MCIIVLLDETQTIDKYIILSEKANCTRLQVEVGRTLEISIYTLMNRALAEIYAFCDRYRNLTDISLYLTIAFAQTKVFESFKNDCDFNVVGNKSARYFVATFARTVIWRA